MKKFIFLLLTVLMISDLSAQTGSPYTLSPASPYLLKNLNWRYTGRQLFQADPISGVNKGGIELQGTPFLSTGAGDTLTIITQGDSTAIGATHKISVQQNTNFNDTVNFKGLTTFNSNVSFANGALPAYTRSNPGAATTFQLKLYAKELTVAGGGGLATDTVTNTGLTGGTALFTTVYSYQATALSNDTLGYHATFQTLGTGNKLPIVRVEKAPDGSPAPAGTKVSILLIGTP